MDAVDEFLDEMQPEETEAEPEVQEEEQQPETGEETQQAAADTSVKPDADKGLQAALLAERRRRQELEAALQQKQEEEKPFLGEEYEQRFQETEVKFQNQLIRQKLDLSESFARDKYADFGDKLEVFETMLQENPALYQEMIRQANPAEFAYKTASNQQKLKEMGDPAEYEKKLRDKITAELEEKYKTQLEAETKKRQQLPGTLAGAKGATGVQTQTWAGPSTLNDILN